MAVPPAVDAKHFDKLKSGGILRPPPQVKSDKVEAAADGEDQAGFAFEEADAAEPTALAARLAHDARDEAPKKAQLDDELAKQRERAVGALPDAKARRTTQGKSCPVVNCPHPVKGNKKYCQEEHNSAYEAIFRNTFGRVKAGVEPEWNEEQNAFWEIFGWKRDPNHKGNSEAASVVLKEFVEKFPAQKEGGILRRDGMGRVEGATEDALVPVELPAVPGRAGGRERGERPAL